MNHGSAGWYPQADGRQRYWDGQRWTEHFAPANGSTQPLPVAGPSSVGRQPSAGSTEQPRTGVQDGAWAGPMSAAPGQPAPAGKPRRVAGWAKVTAAGVAGLVIGAAMPSEGSTPQTLADLPQPTPTVTLTMSTPGPTVTSPGPTVTSTVTPPPQPVPTVTETATVTVTEEAAAPVPFVDPGGGGAAYYDNCSAARAAGVTPLRRGDDGYGPHLDRDDDGIACE